MIMLTEQTTENDYCNGTNNGLGTALPYHYVFQLECDVALLGTQQSVLMLSVQHGMRATNIWIKTLFLYENQTEVCNHHIAHPSPPLPLQGSRRAQLGSGQLFSSI